MMCESHALGKKTRGKRKDSSGHEGFYEDSTVETCNFSVCASNYRTDIILCLPRDTAASPIFLCSHFLQYTQEQKFFAPYMLAKCSFQCTKQIITLL